MLSSLSPRTQLNRARFPTTLLLAVLKGHQLHIFPTYSQTGLKNRPRTKWMANHQGSLGQHEMQKLGQPMVTSSRQSALASQGKPSRVICLVLIELLFSLPTPWTHSRLTLPLSSAPLFCHQSNPSACDHWRIPILPRIPPRPSGHRISIPSIYGLAATRGPTCWHTAAE